jgi:hypothetical protein
MAKQFDLEQAILGCWNITSDIDTLFEEIIEGDLTKDQISNVLLGMSQLYEIKFNKTFRTFEEFLKEYYALSKRPVAPVVPEITIEDLIGDQPSVGDQMLVEAVRQEYHEELADMSDDELVRTIREQYRQPTVKVNIDYKG